MLRSLGAAPGACGRLAAPRSRCARAALPRSLHTRAVRAPSAVAKPAAAARPGIARLWMAGAGVATGVGGAVVFGSTARVRPALPAPALTTHTFVGVAAARGGQRPRSAARPRVSQAEGKDAPVLEYSMLQKCFAEALGTGPRPRADCPARSWLRCRLGVLQFIHACHMTYDVARGDTVQE